VEVSEDRESSNLLWKILATAPNVQQSTKVGRGYLLLPQQRHPSPPSGELVAARIFNVILERAPRILVMASFEGHEYATTQLVTGY
jgi:hypothetical protein